MTENSAGDLNSFTSDEKAPSSLPAAFDTVKPGDQPLASSRVWRSGRPFHHPLPGEQEGNHWEECKKKVDEFDQDFCAGWNGEIDSLLTFAGLFSAVVTAFAAESYKWLQPDPQDVSNQILLNISAQLAGRNATALPAFSPSAASIRINIFWFMSLTFSLTAGLLGILCKQWLRRYQRDASLSHEKGFALRQFRYKGLVRWKVLDILGGLPLLLEIGLMFFFLGLADFLRDLKTEVAVPIIALISAAIGILAITTSAPALQYLVYWARRLRKVGQYVHPPMFAFKSPQSRMLLRIATWLSSPSRKSLEWISCEIQFITYPPTLATYKAHGVAWLDETYSHTLDLVYQICLCMNDITLPGLHQLADELLAVRKCKHKYKHDRKPPREDAVLFEEYAKKVLDKKGVEEGVVRDIVTGVYLDHRLHIDPDRDDLPIVERRVRVLHASNLPVSPELFGSIFKDLPMTAELRWQKAMLFRDLLEQERIPRAHSIVSAELINVCTHHNTFGDEEIESFFNAVHTWMKYDVESRASIAHELGGHYYGAGQRLAPAVIVAEKPEIEQFQRFLDRMRWGV